MCRCGLGARRADVADGNGLVIARRCTRCGETSEVRCFVCLGWFRSLEAHHAKSACGPDYRAGKWWRAVPPTREEVCKVVSGGQESFAFGGAA